MLLNHIMITDWLFCMIYNRFADSAIECNIWWVINLFVHGMGRIPAHNFKLQLNLVNSVFSSSPPPHPPPPPLHIYCILEYSPMTLYVCVDPTFQLQFMTDKSHFWNTYWSVSLLHCRDTNQQLVSKVVRDCRPIAGISYRRTWNCCYMYLRHAAHSLCLYCVPVYRNS